MCLDHSANIVTLVIKFLPLSVLGPQCPTSKGEGDEGHYAKLYPRSRVGMVVDSEGSDEEGRKIPEESTVVPGTYLGLSLVLRLQCYGNPKGLL